MTPYQRKIRLLAAGLLLWGTLGLADDPAPAAADAAPAEAAAESTGGEGEPSGTDEVMDLGAEPDSFTPYTYERHLAWSLLPVFMIGVVLVHLKKSKPAPQKLRAKT